MKLDADDHILLPHVDQMLDCLIECAVPYFDSVAAGTDQESWPVGTPPTAIKRYKISEHM